MTHNLYTIGFTLFSSQHDQLYVHSTCQVQHTWFCNCAVALHSRLDSPLSSTSPTCWQDTGAFSITSLPYLTLFHLRYNGQEYDVSWTMPQCVLCLRLIGQLCWLYSDSAVKYLATFSSFNGIKSCLGLSWDVYDGERQRMKPTSLSPDQVLTDWILGGSSKWQKSSISEESSTCQLSKHSWAPLPFIFCWRLFCRAPVHHEEIPAGEPQIFEAALRINAFVELGHNSGVPSATPSLWSSFIWPKKTFAGRWLHAFPCYR